VTLVAKERYRPQCQYRKAYFLSFEIGVRGLHLAGNRYSLTDWPADKGAATRGTELGGLYIGYRFQS